MFKSFSFRHYNCCVAKLEHKECVSSCAFSPINQQLAVSVSDDFSIKVCLSVFSGKVFCLSVKILLITELVQFHI